MNELHIYPTSRALRNVSSTYKSQGGFLPTLMRMDEFEKRVVLLEDRIQVDPLQRILLLREAASFEAFEGLSVDIDLVRFFTRSEAIFKFYEELTNEQISFSHLAQADAYAEFGEHLALLEQLMINYGEILERKGMIDRAFIPGSYKLNEGFLANYETIEIFLEGYLSQFELELLKQISTHVKVLIHYTTSRFNLKMQERFAQEGIEMPSNSHVVIDFSTKNIVEHRPNSEVINAKVYSVIERSEQIALAFVEIEKLVQQGIDPEEIVLILPDESLKEQFALYDHLNNLNFAMGHDYSDQPAFKRLEALYTYWGRYEKESRVLLEHYGIALDKVDNVKAERPCDVRTFMHTMESMALLDVPLPEHYSDALSESRPNERVYEKLLGFLHTFGKEELSYKEWLFLWMKALSGVTLDDVRGGKVTVMGVLETRGVSFEGVVIVDFNDGIVPASSSKDQFLNSQVRAFAGLPTKSDREALQKQYYKRLLEQANSSVILYATADNRLPSKFLYELGLDQAKERTTPLNLLYGEPSQITQFEAPMVKEFDATRIIWSASRLKTYLSCKRKYYYRYIRKIQAKEDEELNEGSFLHMLLDHLFRSKSSYMTEEEMREKLNRLMDELLPFRDAKHTYQKMLWKEKLKGLIESQVTHFKDGWQVVEREKEFLGEIGGLKFKGRIDRIDQDETRTLVLDYKSGSTSEAQKSRNLEKLTDFQMSIYHHLLQGRYQNVSLAFVKLFEEGKIEEITVLEEKNALLAEHIIELKQTTSFVAEKCETLSTCTYCEFALMCERGVYL